jgi:low affinity Fe/Cu permease
LYDHAGGTHSVVDVFAFAMKRDHSANSSPGAHSSGFDRFARWVEQKVGSPITFMIAVLVVVVWGISGPLFDWSDTWQLVINTGTTIVTFLMVFLIQSTQSRDTQALHLKLDELIRVNRSARNSLLSVEEKSQAEIEEVKDAFSSLATSAQNPAE